MATVRHLGFGMTSYRTTHLYFMVLTSSWNCTLIVFILYNISRFLYSADLSWNCLFTPLLGEFLGILPPNESRYCRNPKQVCPWAKTRHMSHEPWKSVHGFHLEACTRKKYSITNQPGKSHKTVIFHPSGEKPPLNGLKWKFALV